MTQSNDVFRTMSQEEAETLFREMQQELRPLYDQCARVAADTLRVRPVFLSKQKLPKRASMMRKALALKGNAEASAELLAAYLLEKYAEDLGELLDAFGIEHEEGVLKDEAPSSPDKKTLEKVVAEFPQGEKKIMRGVLLKAFAAQSAIDWPELDALVLQTEAA